MVGLLDISQFRSAFTSDGARPNLFQVLLNAPVGSNGASLQDVSLMCRATSLPASTIGPITLNYMGREIKIPGNRKFANWSVTMYNDEDFSIRNLMEWWMNGINEHVGNDRLPQFANDGGGGAPGVAGVVGGYSVNAQVNQLSKVGGTIIKSYNFVGIWPMAVSTIDLDWSTDDAIEEFGVTFAVQWWESTTTDSASGSVTASAASGKPGA